METPGGEDPEMRRAAEALVEHFGTGDGSPAIEMPEPDQTEIELTNDDQL